MGYLGRTKPSETTSSVLRSTYTGNGSTTTYALPGPVANETSIIATINGVTQQDAAYSTDGSNIIFDAAPASGDAIEIRTLSAVAMSYAPMAGSVVTGIIADGAVTTGKLATGAAVANIGNRAITAAQLPVGSVVQVVTGAMSGTGTSTSASYVDDGSLSITPILSSSLIVVICQTACTTAGDWSFFKIVESSTNTAIVDSVPWGNFSSSPQQLQGLNLTGYYTNSNTSTKTFKLQGKNNTGGSGKTRYINYMTGANMILMEITV
ncbi:MAG: hypothetical protein ACOVLB_01720 [Candidatus Nanopelagicus sp.]